MKQMNLLKKESKAYGGELLKTRKGRARGRPLDCRNTMHLVLRSTKAKGEQSFLKPRNKKAVQAIVDKFSKKYGVKILSLANVGNHLHFHIKLTNRYAYKAFIRAITSAIAMAITGASRWKPLKKEPKDRFWDYRPFTRVIVGLRSFLGIQDYVQINQLEGLGYNRISAKFLIYSKRPPPLIM